MLENSIRLLLQENIDVPFLLKSIGFEILWAKDLNSYVPFDSMFLLILKLIPDTQSDLPKFSFMLTPSLSLDSKCFLDTLNGILANIREIESQFEISVAQPFLEFLLNLHTHLTNDIRWDGNREDTDLLVCSIEQKISEATNAKS